MTGDEVDDDENLQAVFPEEDAQKSEQAAATGANLRDKVLSLDVHILFPIYGWKHSKH